MMAIKINACCRLNATYLDPTIFNSDLREYLEGGEVSGAWIKRVAEQRASSPKILYRLVLISKIKKIAVGDRLRLKDKQIMSTSDKVKTAIYAGASYHYDSATNLKNSQLVLVEIRNPVCLISFQQLETYTRAFNSNVQWRTKKEREYIIQGINVIGIVKYHTADVNFIHDETYLQLLD